MNGDNENENGMEEADKLSSGSSEVLDAEQKHASEADTLPIDGQVQVPKPAKNGFWSHLESKSSPILVSENPLPSNPTKKDLFLHAIRCPPHGKLAKILTLTLVIVSLWATCLGMLGEVAQPPNGTIFILIILVVVALFFGWIFSLVRLPPLLGMLLTGILIKNIPGMTFDTYWTKTSSILRGVALVVILMRAGLGLDPQALKRLSVMVFRLAFTPCLAETLTVAVASHFLLNFPWIWGFMLGFVLAAVSPAVVVPCLLGLQERGYGVDKGIPTLVIAAASVDDVLAISGFTILLGITFKPTQDILTVVFQGPKEVVIGLLFGIAWAGLSVMLPGKDDTMMGKLRFVMVFLGGLLAYFGSKSLHLDGAGALAVLVMAFVAGIGWRKRGWSNENAVTSTLSDLWVVFQPILFGLIGTEIRVSFLIHDNIFMMFSLMSLILRWMSSIAKRLGMAWRSWPLGSPYELFSLMWLSWAAT